MAIAALTNKAVKSLMQVAISVGINIEVKTVAQLLGQPSEINEQTGIEKFTSNNEAELDDYQVAMSINFRYLIAVILKR